MKFTLSQVRDLITAVMMETPVENLPYIAAAFRCNSFAVKREESKAFGGTLYSVRVYTHVDSARQGAGFFQGEIWYLHVGQGQHPGARGQYPISYMLNNRTIAEDELTYFGEFVIFDKTGFLEPATERESMTLWVPPARSYNNSQPGLRLPRDQVFQPPLGGNMMAPGFGNAPVYNPGSPYYQQPGYQQPGQQHPGIFPQYHPQNTQPMGDFTTMQALAKNHLRKEFIEKVDRAQIGALAKHIQLMERIRAHVREALDNPSDFEINADGSLQQVFRIDCVVTAPELQAIRRYFGKVYRETGVNVQLTRSMSDQNDADPIAQVSVVVRIS